MGGPRRTVTVESASLIALPGFRLPHLVKVGAVPGCLGNENISAYADTYTKVSVIANGHAVRLVPIRGLGMRTGNTKCVPTFVYEVQDDRTGPFAVAGLRLAVLAGGRAESVTALDGTFVWYFTGSGPPQAQYNARLSAAEAAQQGYFQP